MTRLCFAGPLPPPVNGFSAVCAMMLDILKARMPVEVFNRAANPGARAIGVLQQLLRPLKYFATCIGKRDTVLYLALSGGRGQLIDLSYVLVSKLLRRPIYIHHHSYAYINAPSRLNRCFFALVRNENHIVLSPKMGVSLSREYGLDPAMLRVVSNAAFYRADDARPVQSNEAAPLHLGFLSNITFEKGVVEFFEVLAALERRGIEYRAHVAGPVAPEAQASFDKLLRSTAHVQYAGAVYGEDKERFYRQLDIFLFPTRYVNEAEPLVIYEAMRRGVHVIACDRGSIAEMLRDGAGLVLPAEALVEAAATHIEHFSKDRSALFLAKCTSMQQAQRILSSSKTSLENLVACMQGTSEPVSIPL
ncbi:MAG TPA: glycosyltransferase family 4 protein [Steroidobacteraceae bacterium]